MATNGGGLSRQVLLRRATYDSIYNNQIKIQIQMYRNTLGMEVNIFHPIESESIYSHRIQSYKYNDSPDYTSVEAIINVHGMNYGKFTDNISSLFKTDKPTLYIIDNFDNFKLFSLVSLVGSSKYSTYIINEITNFYDTNKQVAYMMCQLTPYTSNNPNKELIEMDDTIGFNNLQLNKEQIEEKIPSVYDLDWKNPKLDD